MTIVDFLLARIGEDEEAARRAAQPIRRTQLMGGGNPDPDGTYVTWFRREDVSTPSEYGAHEAGTALHHRFNPDRVLAECQAKRRILGQHPHELNADDTVRRCSTCGTPGRCLTVRHLATVYADHPDYQPEWRP